VRRAFERRRRSKTPGAQQRVGGPRTARLAAARHVHDLPCSSGAQSVQVGRTPSPPSLPLGALIAPVVTASRARASGLFSSSWRSGQVHSVGHSSGRGHGRDLGAPRPASAPSSIAHKRSTRRSAPVGTPLQPLQTQLQSFHTFNDYAGAYHHDTFDVQPLQDVNEGELEIFGRRTLEFIHHGQM
jgi:hypothetical protein